MTYELARAAAADLQEIISYTEKTWGTAQARRYRDELELALQQLALTPERGRARDAIVPGMRSFRVAEHVAFYIQRKETIAILRVLHPRMDVDEAFGKDG